MPARVHVAVVGAGDADEDLVSAAEQVGRGLAQRGATVVCGGLGGVMAAACRGAKSAGGLTIGILPGRRRRDANRWVDVAIPTGMGETRNALVVLGADAVVAIGGEHGTLSEVALGLKLGRPVVGLRTWRLTRGDGSVDESIVRADDPDGAVDVVLALAAEAAG
ncbi:MAG TPA: TIGR00725 family protein [Acidimicrobiales bacterium]|nr:TIGR00725 family protein [Acidimicrobiales bacterium]